ncbi:MAG TPA: cyclic nucleotide-binding domain-containing protein [Gaiellaceae bacterium]|nr:cyclic nucleotide-binding domain-containing protein [Gaiellaceae bacterium]
MDPARLRGLGPFAQLGAKERERVARWADEVDVPAGGRLAEEGSFAHEFFVIEEGVAVVERDGKELAELGPGDFFGEIGLLETERRTASVVARTPLRAVVMFQREFKQMERELPAVAAQLRAAIAERLARS